MHYGIAHLIIATLIKAVIYGLVFRLMRALTIPEAFCLAGALLLGGAVFFLFSSRNRSRG